MKKSFYFCLITVCSCLCLSGCVSAYLTYGMIDEKYLAPRRHKKTDTCLEKQRENFRQMMKRKETENEDTHMLHRCIRGHRYNVAEDSVFTQCRTAECVENHKQN